MATSVPRTTGLKPSFASVAARAVPNRSGPTIIGQENRPLRIDASKSSTRSDEPSIAGCSSNSHMHGDLQSSMAHLDVRDPRPASNTLDEQARSNIKRAGLRLDDDHTHTSSSTKPSSLDGKSTTSGTTFAFDEKESLRPDDSASVQAVDDDDTGSGAATGALSSRLGSEAGSRAFRDQFYEITENAPSRTHRSYAPSRKMISEIKEEGPQLTPAPLAAPAPAQILVNPDNPPVSRPLISFEYRGPDDKLFEALDSPKDRMFLLRLEQDIIDFIKNSTEPQIQLPPCNSFCRLLAHKLADYYALTHFVDNAQSAVTLYRTPYCRIPTPLGLLAKSNGQELNGTAQVTQPAMKIMRRPGLARDSQAQPSGTATAESSVVPSKAGSEIGEDSQQGTGAASPTESTLARDKTAMSRAEREARYKEKREQIFGPESDNPDSSEVLNEGSRSSSRNEEKKRKRKHKNNNDDFEARSQFNAYYPTMQFAVNPYDPAPSSVAYFNAYNLPQNAPHVIQPSFFGNGMTQQPYQSSFQPTIPGTGLPVLVPQNFMANSYSVQPPLQGYDQQNSTQYFAMSQPPVPVGQHPAGITPMVNGSDNLLRTHSQVSDHQFSHNGYTYPYQPQNPQPAQSQQQQGFPQAIPYQFGQLPLQANVQNGKLAHPLPGSYTRPPTFNPQTRSFIPNGGAAHAKTPPNTHSPMLQGPHSPATPFSNGSQTSQASTYPPKSVLTQPVSQTHKISTNRKSTAQPNGSNSPLTSSLSKWGTPPNLPPKPPPPEMPGIPDLLPSPQQTLSAGQPMPHYQNGVYSLPVAGHK